MRIGLDAMGGDFAPAEQVKGALAARDLLAAGDRIVLFGQREAVEPLLSAAPGWQEYIELHHCAQAIGMAEPPVEAIRTKPDSSIARMAREQRSRRIDAMISAGNTGANVAACQMHLRRLTAVHRPGIAIMVPTFHTPVTICDVGANVSCRPAHLAQYGVMASLYAHHVAGIQHPRVGLLSIGAEEGKGNTLVRDTTKLLRAQEGVNFVGNVEGRDLFRNTCDVVVCEGFVGNVVLKLMEGLAEGLFGALTKRVEATEPRLGGAMSQLMARYDYSEYGGAPLLGVNGICIIGHGSSNAKATYNAIRVAREFAAHGINELITEKLGQYTGNVE